MADATTMKVHQKADLCSALLPIVSELLSAAFVSALAGPSSAVLGVDGRGLPMDGRTGGRGTGDDDHLEMLELKIGNAASIFKSF